MAADRVDSNLGVDRDGVAGLYLDAAVQIGAGAPTARGGAVEGRPIEADPEAAVRRDRREGALHSRQAERQAREAGRVADVTAINKRRNRLPCASRFEPNPRPIPKRHLESAG